MRSQRAVLPICLLGLLCSFVSPVAAQWEVKTFVPGGNGMEDAIVQDASGNLYVSQYDGITVWKITPEGNVSAFAQGFNAPNGLAIDRAGNLYVANALGGRVSRVSPSGEVEAAFVTGLVNPAGVALNPAEDTLYIAHYQTSRISKVALANPSAVVPWVTGGLLNGPVPMVFDEAGVLYVGNFNNGALLKIMPDGSQSVLAAIPPFMGAMTYRNGTFYATSLSTHRIYRIDQATGEVVHFAGSGQAGQTDGPALQATFNGPNGIAVSASGDTLFVSDYNAKSLRMLVAEKVGTSKANSPELPRKQPQIGDNFPNPFTHSTTIPVDWPFSTPITLDLYNALGQRVRQLSVLTGAQQVEWNGRDDSGWPVMPGVYYAVLATDQTRVSRALLLVR